MKEKEAPLKMVRQAHNAERSRSNVLNFIAEAGLLKRVYRSGWSVLGIKDAESVADHAFRCAVIGYVLAKMERVPAYNVLLMTVFNDIHEARITDLHKMAQRYLDAQPAEDRAFTEQISGLPREMQEELENMRRDYTRQTSKESIIARDADILECLIQAKEYYEQGFSEAMKFTEKAPGYLKTKSARELWKQAKTMNLHDWWMALSEFKR
ncbi:MAG: HD domain-containing protein [Candidatus Omnitrophota bacterium]